MSLFQELALLTDNEAELCLNGILKGLISSHPMYEDLVSSPKEMEKVIQMAASDLGKQFPQIGEVTPQDRPKAIRIILTEIAQNADLSPRLDAWFKTARPKLLEPITGAVVLAGIIMVLSTNVSIKYENEDGKKNIKVKIEKAPTASALLEKIAGFFV
ncbi:MAG: hypothetical protein AB1489_07965 [Acidobacteriota bacterium]